MNLRLDYCTFHAATYACKRWHYSKSIPAGKIIKIGVWENDVFIGCVLFSRGARFCGSEIGLTQLQVCELTRVALNKHITPVSRILSIAISLLIKKCPGLKAIISYADENRGHLGKIYQATNWVYFGKYANEQGIVLNNKLIHRRTINAKYGTSDLEFLKKNVDKGAMVIKGLYKHKYVYPLTETMRKYIMKFKKDYPKIASEVNEITLGDHSSNGGASPTRTLHLEENVS